MESKFLKLYNVIMEDSIFIENIESIYYNLDIIYENNKILKCPEIIVKTVKKYVDQVINSSKSGEFKIFIKDIINDDYLIQFDEDEKLYSCLKNLFKDKQNAYVLLKVQKIENEVPYLTINRNV